MREKHIPLFALESQDPVKEFDFLCFTIQYEMCYTNILQVLDLWAFRCLLGAYGGRPHRDRRRPRTYNPEPLADPLIFLYWRR